MNTKSISTFLILWLLSFQTMATAYGISELDQITPSQSAIEQPTVEQATCHDSENNKSSGNNKTKDLLSHSQHTLLNDQNECCEVDCQCSITGCSLLISIQYEHIGSISSTPLTFNYQFSLSSATPSSLYRPPILS